MIIMEENELLKEVKNGAGKLSDYHNDVIIIWIREVKEFLLSAGIDEAIVNSKKAVGIITRGVLDLWNYGSGEGKFSEYFIQRAIQLKYEKVSDKDV